MPSSPAPPAPAPERSQAPVSADALRLVLFGLPGAGKSSLLGALAETALAVPSADGTPAPPASPARKEPPVNGLFTAVSEGMQQLRQTLHQGNPPKTQDEVVAHAITFQAGPEEEPQPVQLVDCNGEVVEKLLAESRSGNDKAGSALRQAVLGADGLILLVDASASARQLEEHFGTFGQFLHYLEGRRGRSAEVTGLPVFLVLTKCDRLARPGDSLMDWMEHVEERKQEVGDHFRAFLARQEEEEGQAPFGQVDLNIWATAVRRPALGRAHARTESFGVAELFRQSLELADDYRERKLKADRRLFWTVSSSVLTILFMVAVALGLAVTGPDRSGDDLDAYFEYLTRLQETPRPVTLGSVEDLRALRKRLEGELALRPEWERTEAGRLHKDLLQELDQLQLAIEEVRKWFRRNGDRARALANFDGGRVLDRVWYGEVRDFLTETRQAPLLDPQAPAGSQAFMHDELLGFEEVSSDRDAWLRTRERLTQVRNVTAAFALRGPVDNLPPALKLTAPFDLRRDAPIVVALLRQAYPDFAADFVLDQLPGAIQTEVAQAARQSYEILTASGREAVQRKLRQDGWDRLRGWLDNPSEWTEFASGQTRLLDQTLAALGLALPPPGAVLPQEAAALGLAAQTSPPLDVALLLRTLARLFDDPEPLDPVADLRTFLSRDRFTISPRTLTLEIPRDLVDKVPGNATLTLTHVPRNGDQQTLVYRRPNEDRPRRNDRTGALTYTLVRKGDDALVYHPGDELKASLPLQEREVLRWDAPSSARYQFEKLSLPPRLYALDNPADRGSVEKGIHLRGPRGKDGLPRLPDLLPRTEID